MWCTQTPKPSTMVATVASATTRVADQRAAAEDRQAVRHHAHRRQHDGVDPGMAEHPEQMLPQQRLAAAGRVEEMRAELAVHPQQEEGQADARAWRRCWRPMAVSVPQIRIGTRLIDMPGARMRRKVTTKLIAPTVVEMPSRIMPSA